MTSEVSLIVTVSLIIFIAPYIAKILQIPTTPIEMIFGALAGYFGFIGYNHFFELIAEVGFFFLMFLAGTEINLRILLETDRKILKLGFIYIGLLYLLSFLVSKVLDFTLLFTVMLPLISLGLLTALSKEFDKKTKWLRLAIAIGVLGEFVSIGVLTVTGAILEYGNSRDLYETLGLLVFFIFAILFLFEFFRVLFWWYPTLKTYLLPVYADKEEKDIRLSMALFFMLVAAMLLLDLESAFGAFIAGVFIATFFEHNRELPLKLSSFGFGFLVPIFFIYIGSTFQIESLFDKGLLWQAVLIACAMLFIRLVASLALKSLLNFKEWLYFSLSHAMPLTLLVSIASLAYHNSGIDRMQYYAFILAGLFEVFIVMSAIKWIYAYFDKNSNRLL